MKKSTAIITKKEIPKVLKYDVSGEYFGVCKTFKKVRERYYWENYKEDIKN